MGTMIWTVKGWFGDLLKDMPEGVKVVTEFVWKVRWFLFAGWCVYLVVQVLPYLLVALLVRQVLSIFG